MSRANSFKVYLIDNIGLEYFFLSLFISRSHVLVMDFIGEDGFPAPLLKDANIDESLARKLYLDCVRIMHRFFNEAKLVHADLSEFNML